MGTRAFELDGLVNVDVKAAVDGLDKVDDKLKKTSDSLGDTEKKTNKSGDAFAKLGNMGKSAMSTIDKWVKRGAVAVTGLTTAFITMGIKSNASLETSTASWETLLGTQDKAKQMMKDITQYAAKTPFSKMGVDIMAKHLHNAGYEGQGLFDQLTKFGNMGSAFGVQEDSLKEMVRQYAQVQMATVAYTEDLNILQDRGIPIYKGLAEVTGKTVAEVKKMASEGKITADVYNQALDKIASSTEGAMDKQSKTLAGMWSTLRDNATNISQKILEPLFNKMVDEWMPKAMTFTDNLTANLDSGKGVLESIKLAIADTFGEETLGKIKAVIKIIEGIAGAYIALKSVIVVAKVVESIKIIIDVVKALELAQLSLNFAFLSNPITWVIMLIGGLIAVGVLLWKNWDEISAKCSEIWGAIKSKIEEHGGGIKGTIGFLGECMKEGWNQVWNFMDEKTGGTLTAIKGKIEEHGGGIKGLWGAQWDAMNELTGGKLDRMKETVFGWGDNIKNFFSNLHFPEIKLPHIKLPHFNLSGSFSLNPLSVPKLNVDWYNKGGIFTQPTVLGNIGVGDADNGRGSQAEAVLPISDLRQMIKDLLQITIAMNVDGREFTRQVVAPHQDELNNYAYGR